MVQQTLGNFGNGAAENSNIKIREYADRIKAGESFEKVLEGLGPFYRNPVIAILKTEGFADKIPGLKTLTKDELSRLPFDQIRERMTQEQVKTINTWATSPEIGYESIDDFFADAAKETDEGEQGIFRDYLIKCLI